MVTTGTFTWTTLAFLLCTSMVLTEPARAERHTQADSIEYVIHIAIDGMRGVDLDVMDPERVRSFTRLRNEGAYTGNARSDYHRTVTMPNHATILTGRPVFGAEGHGLTFNDDNGQTLHRTRGGYTASTFDVAHDHGLRTGLYYSKDKFIFYARTWNAQNGAPDQIGEDNGTDKIDVVRYRDDIVDLTTQFIEQMQERPQQYAFLAYRDLDSIGHARRWGSNSYYNAVERVDGELGRIFDLIDNDTTFAGRTAIVLTADHGGFNTGHDDHTRPEIYSIPMAIWGPGVQAGVDLYELNWTTRAEPCGSRPNYEAEGQPIRNGDSGNVAMMLLGLPPVPGSVFNTQQELAVALPDSVAGIPEVQFDAPTDGAVSAPGANLEVRFSATSPNGTITTVSVLGNCEELVSFENPPYVGFTWAAPPLGNNVLQAVATDEMGLFGMKKVRFEVAGGVTVDGKAADWLSLGTIPLLDADSLQSDPELALDRLYIAQDSANYFFGFDVPAVSKQVTYALYFDTDKYRFSGGTEDPMGFALATDDLHRPEAVLHLEHRAEDVWSAPLYSVWDEGGFWRTISGLPGDGRLEVDAEDRFLELTIPRDAEGFDPDQGFFVELVTIGSAPGAGASESIPSDANITFDSENTADDVTTLSAFGNFNFPPPPGDGITVDGRVGDWIGRGIPRVRDEDGLQTEPDFKLRRFFIVHDDENYFFGFDANPGSKDVWFGVYIDSDGVRGSGGLVDARGNAISAAEDHLPEVQIYLRNDTTGQWAPSGPEYYVWDPVVDEWMTTADGGLPNGSAFKTRSTFVEFSIPQSAKGIEYADRVHTALFTVGSTPGAGASESVPSSENIAFTEENASTDVTVLTEFHDYSIRPIVVDVGLDELPSRRHDLTHYPNPLSRLATFVFSTADQGNARLEVLDLLGRRVLLVMDGEVGPGQHRLTADTEVLPSGTYIYRLASPEGVVTGKMVVVH